MLILKSDVGLGADQDVPIPSQQPLVHSPIRVRRGKQFAQAHKQFVGRWLFETRLCFILIKMYKESTRRSARQ